MIIDPFGPKLFIIIMLYYFITKWLFDIGILYTLKFILPGYSIKFKTALLISLIFQIINWLFISTSFIEIFQWAAAWILIIPNGFILILLSNKLTGLNIANKKQAFLISIVISLSAYLVPLLLDKLIIY